MAFFNFFFLYQQKRHLTLTQSAEALKITVFFLLSCHKVLVVLTHPSVAPYSRVPSTCCSWRLGQSTNILGFSLHHDHLRVRTMVSAARGW